MIRLSFFFTLLVACAALWGSPSFAAVVHTDDLDSGTDWVVTSSNGDTSSVFGFDYSVHGIPSAPNGTGTTGLKLTANDSIGTGSAVAATRDLAALGLTSADKILISVDIWSNFEAGSGSATEFTGAGVGHDGTTGGRNGASLLSTGDGGSSRDYRLFKDAGEQFFASGQYNPALPNNNGAAPQFESAFPSIDIAAATGSVQGPGSTDPGDSGFQWYEMTIVADPSAGLTTFAVRSSVTGQRVEVGTINANIGSSVDMFGSLALVQADLFDSLNTSGLNFGLFDNVEVSVIPEPVSLTMAGWAIGIAMVGRRRR